MIADYFKAGFLFFLLLLIGVNISAQITLEGRVKAADTNEPAPYAIINEVQSKHIMASNEQGIFKIAIDSLPALLEVSSIGYATRQIEVTKSDQFLNIMLQPVSLNISEVNVYASRGNMQASSLETLRSVESYKLAGTTKDIFRSIQMLPGVSSNNAMSAQYNVRGGTIDENLMLINGIEVAEPYHIKVFPMASIGIFNIDLVDRIDFSGGGFSAEYGNALSSALNVSYRQANRDSIKGTVSLGLIDLGIVAEIPMSKKISLLCAGRRSYLDPIIKMISPEEKISVRYYDIQTKLDYDLNPRHKISLLAIYSDDKDKIGPQVDEYSSQGNIKFQSKSIVVKSNKRNNFLMDAKYSDLLVALTTRHILSGRFVLNSEFSFYREDETSPIYHRDTTNYEYSKADLFNQMYYYRDDIKSYNLMNYEGKLSGKIMFNQHNNSKIGLYFRRSDLDYTRTLIKYWDSKNNLDKYPDTTHLVTRPTDIGSNSVQYFKANAYKVGGYLTHAWQATPKLTLNLGMRADYFELNKELDISPRTNLSYAIQPDLKVSASWGIFYQSPIMKQLKYSYVTTDNTKSQKATHYLLGFEKKSNNTTFKIETYYKKYDQLLPLERTSLGEILYEVKDNIANGYSMGIDVEYIVTKEHFDFWLNYSLGSAKERLNGTSHYYSRYTDQRHSLSSMLLFKLKKQNEISFKMTYGSGYAYQSMIYNTTLKQWKPYDEIASAHLPYYLSIDLRYQKEFKLFSNASRFYLDLMNVLNRKNIVGHQYSVNNSGPYEEDTNYLGFLPTFGLMFDF